MKAKIAREAWRQIGGDMNPSQHGALLARFDGEAVELREIQPVRSYVGDGEALDVGFPFWSKEAYYDPEDLSLYDESVQSALRSCDLGLDDLAEMSEEQRILAMAEACIRYGYRSDEGPAGWAKDVCPEKVYWWATPRARGWRHLADEDQEFRTLQRENRS